MLNRSYYAPHNSSVLNVRFVGGTAAAVPPLFRLSDPALCGSCPLVTPYYCRLGDLFCVICVVSFSVYYFVFVSVFCCFVLFVIFLGFPL